jgi:hypothetical protein
MDRLTAARCNAARCNVAGCGCAQVATTREENRKLRLEMQALLTVRRSVRSRPRLLPQCTAATLHDSAPQCDEFRSAHAAPRCNTLRRVATCCAVGCAGRETAAEGRCIEAIGPGRYVARYVCRASSIEYSA